MLLGKFGMLSNVSLILECGVAVGFPKESVRSPLHRRLILGIGETRPRIKRVSPFLLPAVYHIRGH